VARSAEETYGIATDFQTYVNFIPALKAVEVLDPDPAQPKVSFRIEAPFQDIKYTSQYRLEPPGRVSWDMVESNVLKGNSGFWSIESAGEGACRVTYSMKTELPVWLKFAVSQDAFAREIGKTVERFKEYVEKS